MRPTKRLLTAFALAAAASLSIVLAGAPGDPTGSQAGTAERALPERVDGHRPLRANPPDQEAAPGVPEPFTGYDDAPEHSVVSRLDELSFYPCEDCHGMLPANPQRRQLYAPHPADLDHGAGRIWCLDCHAADKRNVLMTLAAQEVPFDEAYRVCGQCHYNVQKDWAFGAHGKRVAKWQGDRELYNCTHCHNPHDPAVRPRAPEPPPPVRVGLEPMPHAVHGHQGESQPEESTSEESDDE
jgi:hypothetical protein